MKKIYKQVLRTLFALLGLCALQQLRAQVPVITLSTPKNDDTKIATQRVELRPGFSSHPALNQRFQAYIDRGYRDLSPYTSTQITSGSISVPYLPLGATKVISTVSPTGAANCQIPIFTPPGTAGIEPSIALVYNSQSPSGLAGVGWSLSGLSAITRVSKNFVDDSYISAIKFDNTDRFVLDGQRLLTIDESQYSLYEPTIKNFTQITKIGTDPTSFTAIAKDGTQFEYGVTEDARCYMSSYMSFAAISNSLPVLPKSKAFQWMLNKVTDANGNFMKYRYQDINGQTVLAQIDYTGNTDLPYNSILFDYAQKTDGKTGYLNGSLQGDFLLLKGITVYNEGSVVRRYACSYVLINGQSSLNQVTEYGADNTTEIGKTIVEWGTLPNTFVSTQTTIPVDGSPWENLADKSWQSGDIDGDGIAELIGIHTDVPIINSFSKSNGFSVFKKNNINGDFTKIASFSCISALSDKKKFTHLRGTSRTFEGKTRYIVPQFTSDAANSYIWFHLIDLKMPLSSSTYKLQLERRMDDDLCIEPLWTLGDINNDGIDEIIYVDSKYSSSITDGYKTPVKIIYPKTENTFDTGGFDFSSTIDEKFVASQIIVADFNTDGLNDLIIIHDKGYNIYFNQGNSFYDKKVIFGFPVKNTQFNSSYSFIKIGDFNGDGAIDLIVNEPTNSNWFLLTNNGSGVFNSTKITAWNMQEESFTSLNDDEDNCLVTDFNNDGKSDVIIFDYTYHRDYLFGQENGGIYDSTTVSWYKSNGQGFDLVKRVAIRDEGYSRVNGTVLGDFNGDGREDIVNLGGKLTEAGNSGGFTFTTNYNSAFNDGLVTKVSSSPKNYVEFYYQPLTETKHASNAVSVPFYTKGTSAIYPVLDLQAPLYCVRSTKQPDALGNESFIDYTYQEALIHLQGRGFLGFKQTNNNNYVSKRKMQFITEFDADHYYLPKTQLSNVINLTNNTVLATTTNNFKNETLSRGQYSSKLSSIVSSDYFGTSSITNNEFDGAGNIISTSVDLSGGFLQSTTYENFVAVGKSIFPSCAQKITTTKKHPDDDKSFQLTSSCVYDTKRGNMTSKIDNVGIPGKEVSTTYSEFTAHGLPRTIKSSATSEGGAVLQSFTKTYDKYSRFVLSETDVTAGQTSSYTYNTKYGTKLDATTRGQITKYEYDNCRGLLLNVRDPRGNTVSTGYIIDPATGGYIVTETPSYGQAQSKYYDVWGKQIKISTLDYAGTSVKSTNTYNADGTLQNSTSEFGGTQTESTNYIYNTQHGKVESQSNSITGASIAYVYSGLSVTKTINGTKTTTTIFDRWGNPKTITDPTGVSTAYTYYSCGKTKSISSPGYSASMQYDALGYQTDLDDSDAGKSSYRYDALGRLTYQKTAAADETLLKYDTQGRIQYKQNIATGNQFEYYEYETSNNGFGNVKSVTNKTTGAKEEYVYDTYGQLTQSTKTIDANIVPIVFKYQFDNYGNNTGITYPDGMQITRKFSNGRLIEVLQGTPDEVAANTAKSFWKLDKATATELSYTSGSNFHFLGFQTKKTFNSNGTLASIVSKNKDWAFVDEQYSFDAKTGILNSRQDNRWGKQRLEEFGYNDLEQLTSVKYTLNGFVQTQSGVDVKYKTDNSCNIDSKTGVGSFVYTSGNHALTGINQSPNALSNQTVQYNYLGLPSSISQVDDASSYTFSYDPLGQRNKMTINLSSGTSTVYYAGLYEQRKINNEGVCDLYYVNGGDGLAAVIKKSSTATTITIILKDYQGSIVATQEYASDCATGNLYSYNAWGQARDFDDWAKQPSRWPIGNRGHLCQEYLPDLGLINLNARLYDPALGLFLAPDNYMQAPGFRPNHNRYMYCMGNPLKYTDESGNFIFTLAAAIFCPPLVPLAMTVDYGWMSGGLRSNSQGKGFWYGAWRGGLVSAAGGGLSMIGGSSLTFAQNLGLGIAEGAVVGGLDAALWHENILKGAGMGALAGALLTTITSENMNNAINGKGFKTNSNVFEDFRDGIYSDECGVWQQDALDYFGFEGNYKGNLNRSAGISQDGSFAGCTNMNNGQISYGDIAFYSYGNLHSTYTKEMFTHNRVLNGTTAPKLDIPGIEYYPEEAEGFIYIDQQRGLYKTTIDYYKNARLYTFPTDNLYQRKWWDFINYFPRRW